MSIRNDMLLIKARIAEKNEFLKRLAISASNHIITIRNKVDANLFDRDEDFTELDLEKAKAAMDDLFDIWKKAKEIKDQIARLERELNG